MEGEDPLCYIALSEDYSYQTFITFHPNDPHQLISNSADLVVFYYWVVLNNSNNSVIVFTCFYQSQDKNDIKADSHPILDKVLMLHATYVALHEQIVIGEQTK